MCREASLLAMFPLVYDIAMGRHAQEAYAGCGCRLWRLSASLTMCRCGRFFPTSSQLPVHQGRTKQQLYRLAAVQSPPATVTKRQKLLKQPKLPEGQAMGGNTDSQPLQRRQPVRSDFFDALFGRREQPCADAVEETLSHGEQPCGDGQQSSPADIAALSPMTPALKPAVAAHDASLDSGQAHASPDAQHDVISAIGRPAAVLVHTIPEMASLPQLSRVTSSRVSPANPWAEDHSEVFKPRDLDFSQAGLAHITKDKL